MLNTAAGRPLLTPTSVVHATPNPSHYPQLPPGQPSGTNDPGVGVGVNPGAIQSIHPSSTLLKREYNPSHRTQTHGHGNVNGLGLHGVNGNTSTSAGGPNGLNGTGQMSLSPTSPPSLKRMVSLLPVSFLRFFLSVLLNVCVLPSLRIIVILLVYSAPGDLQRGVF